MIDNFALALTHGLMLIALWRLMSRPDLEDDDAPVEGKSPWSVFKSRGDA